MKTWLFCVASLETTFYNKPPEIKRLVVKSKLIVDVFLWNSWRTDPERQMEN